MEDTVRRQFLEMRGAWGSPGGPSAHLRRTPSADPEVVELFVADATDQPRQVVTGWRGPARRPVNYPEDLPFLPGVRVFVSEFPDGEGRTGARWLVEGDPVPVVEGVVRSCLAAGWVADPGRAELMSLPGLGVVLRRADQARLVLSVELEGGGTVVQLLSLV